VQGAATIAQRIEGVQLITELDYSQFAKEGTPYLERVWAPEWLTLQRARASEGFEKERRAVLSFLEKGTCVTKKLTFDELFALVKTNLCIAMVRVHELYQNRKEGSHFVVLYGNDGDNIWLHDPGRPPARSQRISRARVFSAYGLELISIPLGAYKFGPS
jgi:hypothetical protein